MTSSTSARANLGWRHNQAFFLFPHSAKLSPINTMNDKKDDPECGIFSSCCKNVYLYIPVLPMSLCRNRTMETRASIFHRMVVLPTQVTLFLDNGRHVVWSSSSCLVCKAFPHTGTGSAMWLFCSHFYFTWETQPGISSNILRGNNWAIAFFFANNCCYTTKFSFHACRNGRWRQHVP